MMSTENKPLTVKCPTCGTRITWSEKYPDRPFCSERCRNQDFCAWANEEHQIPGSPVYDEILSEELYKSE